MNIFSGIWNDFFPNQLHVDSGPVYEESERPIDNHLAGSKSNTFWSGRNMVAFDGEKTPYEMGTPLNYDDDYYRLRARTWQAYLESDIVQNAIRKYCLWIVGQGLKLQSTPEELIIKKAFPSFGKDQLKEFTDSAESYFRLHAKSRESDYSRMTSLHLQAAAALKNAIMAGDVLCIARFDGKNETIQIIDGNRIYTPILSDELKAVQKRGNTVVRGVEINKRGEHIAFFVFGDDLKFTRVLARGAKTKKLQAWLMYGSKYKLNSVRGLSLFSAVLETVAKMDRYKSATLGGAEENAKIPLSIEHNQFSDGENPMQKQMAQSFGKDKGTAKETFNDCEQVATKVAQTTEKSVYNMPIGSKLMMHKGSSDLHFGDFFGVNAEIVYATIGIPPEVAFDKFGGAYSGSRAALKSWEYKMMVDRANIMQHDYYQPFYNFWLDINVLNGTIQAPGYLQALVAKDTKLLNAYRLARFIGATVPHIDPVKEANASRIKLGKAFGNIPLTTGEQESENLNTGDFDKNLIKAENEFKKADTFVDALDADSTVIEEPIPSTGED
jgi:capsid protein